MNRALAVLVLVSLAACAGGGIEEAELVPPPGPRLALSAVGDSVVYLEQTTAVTLVVPGADTVEVRSRHDAVVHVVRTAPDTLEGFYEYLTVGFRSRGEEQVVDTDPLLGVRFVLHEDRGRIETLAAPELPGEVRQLTDLRRQFQDFFLRLPATPLAVGLEWVDTVRSEEAMGEGSSERLAVTRFHVRGDSVVDGITGRIIGYETAVETTMRSAPTTQGTLSSSMVGGEEGTFVYSPERELMLRRWRTGRLEGEFVLEGNLETRRIPQVYRYESRIELLAPGGRRTPGAGPRAEP